MAYKIRQNVLKAIKQRDIRRKLCVELKVTDQTIMDYISRNEPNGPLTTYGALHLIKTELGIVLVDDCLE